jgi:tRNA pseudouridine38-40 synthase
MRYFLEMAYNGTRFTGWQRQPGGQGVQNLVETALSTLLRHPVEVTGCGRTDTGVHASYYVLHFDSPISLDNALIGKLNRFTGPDLAFFRLAEVAPEAHARYDAYLRSYTYFVDIRKNPFHRETAFHFPFFERLDLEKMSAAASMLLEFEDFAPFCKTHTDVKTMRCQLSRAEWTVNQGAGQLVFHISANRFLRGMVRLIVGECLNIGLGKNTIEGLRRAMERQTMLERAWTVPAEGLFLCEVKYPYEF